MSIVVYFELERGKERVRKALPSMNTIRWATDFASCVTLAGESNCTGVILGVYFSNGTVFEFISALKNKHPALPVVCCCSYLATSTKWDTPIESACRVLGASGYISYDRFFSQYFVQEISTLLPEIAQQIEVVSAKDATKQYD
jgi:DNA-binding NarL/FixJ family response regulator